MNRLVSLVLVCLGAQFAHGAESGPEATPPAGAKKENQVPNFGLLDYRGRYHEVRRTEARVVVLYVAGNGCPVVRQSITKLRAIRSKFAPKGVVVWMLNANPQDTRAEIAAEAEEFRVGSIPILMDEQQVVAHGLGLTRTAEAIAINTADMKIVYRGAIDDQLVEGAKRPNRGNDISKRP